MRIFNLFPFLLAFSALLLTACEENPFDGLPPATQEGKNVMAFKVNGKAWKNDASAWDPGVEASYYQGHLLLSGVDQDAKGISFSIEGITGPGSYPIQNRCWEQFLRSCVIVDHQQKQYVPADNTTALLIITRLDTVGSQPICSGTFAFDAVGMEDPTDTLHITDGRFDIQI